MSDEAPQSAKLALAPGTVFGERYRIGSLLGKGGMGSVYRAEDLVLGEDVALKVLTSPGGKNAIDRFRREVRVARRVTHPNVVRIHDIGEAQGKHFLTMELVEGSDLSSLLGEHRALPWPRAASLLLGIARALGAAHAAGVVHRDLKPSNVLVSTDGRVVLSDFGLARAIEEDAFATAVGSAMVGTLLYMAPEQVIGEPLDARVDVYALGLLGWELLVGEPPFRERTPMATAIARLHRPPPDPRSKADVPHELAMLILHCLARPREARPLDGGAVADRLIPFAGDEKGARDELARTAAQGSAREPVSRSSRSRDHAVVVQPFRYAGPPEHAGLASVLGDLVIDLLARTPSLRVMPASLIESLGSLRSQPEGERTGRAGALAVVEGVVNVVGPRMRVSVRVMDGDLGAQLWSERFESGVGDAFEIEDGLGRRIVEALRVGVATSLHRGDAPLAVIQPYLKARRALMRTQYGGLEEVVAQLEKCLADAPQFVPAIAAHATACLRAWFIPGASGARSWEREARASVARALDEAGDLPESHLASAILCAQDGAFRDARLSLEGALEIAPTYAEAQLYLGRLALECGRAEPGVRLIEGAIELQPNLDEGLSDLMRQRQLEGRTEEADALLTRILQKGEELYGIRSAARLAVLRGDKETLKALSIRIGDADHPERRLVGAYIKAACGDISFASLRAIHEGYADATANRRFHTLLKQLRAEVAGLLGDKENALEELTRAARDVLVDIVWLERASPLALVRGEPRYAEAQRIVKERADGVFR